MAWGFGLRSRVRGTQSPQGCRVFPPHRPDLLSRLIPHAPYVITELPHDTTRAVTNLLFAGCFTSFREILFFFSHAGGTWPILSDRCARLGVQVQSLACSLPHAPD